MKKHTKVVAVSVCIFLTLIFAVFCFYQWAKLVYSGLLEGVLSTLPSAIKENPQAVFIEDINSIEYSIKKYKAEHKTAPRRLSNLVPKYLDKIPQRGPDIKYELSADGRFILINIRCKESREWITVQSEINDTSTMTDHSLSIGGLNTPGKPNGR